MVKNIAKKCEMLMTSSSPFPILLWNNVFLVAFSTQNCLIQIWAGYLLAGTVFLCSVLRNLKTISLFVDD